MDRLGFVLTAPCSGGERLGGWLSQRRSVFVTENMLFGRFCELWPDDRGQMLPSMTVDRFVNEWSRTTRVTPLGMDRGEFQRRFLDEMIELIVAFGLRHSRRSKMLDLVMPFPGTQAQVEAGLSSHCPDSPRIKLVRDGRDVLIDQAFRWLLKDSHGTNRYGFFVERRPSLKLTRFLDDAFLERWARVWNDVSTSRLADRSGSLPPTINYETWAADPAATLKLLTDHFGLDPYTAEDPALTSNGAQASAPVTISATSDSLPGSVESTSETTARAASAGANKGARQDRLLQRVRRIATPFRTSIGAWKELLTREDGRQIQMLAGAALAEHGYVDDPKWYEALPPVLDPERLEAVARYGDEETVSGTGR